jgi:hypothetical protein
MGRSVIGRAAFGTWVASASWDHELLAFDRREDDDLEQVAGAVGADEEPTVGFFSGVFDRTRMVDGVEHALVGDAVFASSATPCLRAQS